jgi:hypothetical protein
VPADLTKPAVSPTDEVRAAFILGGLAVLTDDARIASESTPQVVNLRTFTEAAVADAGDAFLDGNDGNNVAAGTGLELGECPAPAAACSAQSNACSLGNCRAICSIFSNSYRNLLSSAVSKFIGTRPYPSVWNQTGLGSEDARTMLDNIARNTDPDLFNDACLDSVDRIPPTITWVSPRDGETFIKGDTVASFTASDDTGAEPKSSFIGLADEDGDLTNRVARTTLRTRGAADGPITITAFAVDTAGNERRAMRTLEIDNTAPAVALDSSPFYADVRAWWTATPAVTLRGTLTELHPKTLTVTVGDVAITATMNGASWSVDLADGMISSAGTVVTVRAEDLAGNVTTKQQILRLDTEAPTFAMNATTVKDERSDTVGFIGVTPNHTHSGPSVSLGNTGCPDVYKYAYLLDANPPLFGGETGARNPLAWSFQLTDDGAGLDPNPAHTQFRVRAGGATLLDWTNAPTADTSDVSRRIEIRLYRDGTAAIPALGTYEGPIEIDFRGQDRFAHEVSSTRCWTHHPLAAPVHIGNAYTPGNPTDPSHPAHPLSLNAHGLEAARIQDLSSLLLNDNSTGASTMDTIVSNGTAEVVYLTVNLTAPENGNVHRTYSIAYNAVLAEDTDDDCSVVPSYCATLPLTDPPVSETFPAMATPFEVRLFTANAAGAPVSEVLPCTEAGCMNTTFVRTFRLNGRTSATAIPRYVATAWLRQAVNFRPGNLAPPFIEFDQAGQRHTGKQWDEDFCTRTAVRGFPRVTYCTQRTYYKKRQSVDFVSLDLGTMRHDFAAATTPVTTGHPTSSPFAFVLSTPYLSIY